MALGILLILVGGGITGIAVLLHLLGLSKPATLQDEAAAAKAWADEFPEDPALKVVLCHDRHAALITTARGRGVVWPMGADTTARYLTGARIHPTKTGLRIDLPDFTAPHIHLTLDADEARAWPALMEQTA
jgi:hypothetical protein